VLSSRHAGGVSECFLKVDLSHSCLFGLMQSCRDKDKLGICSTPNAHDENDNNGLLARLLSGCSACDG
jgi:hypothetical protein